MRHRDLCEVLLAGRMTIHMSHSAAASYLQVYEGDQMQGAKLKTVDELEKVFKAAGVDPQAPLVCSCGSGLTACVLALALHQVSGQLAPVYDGSWSEWAAVPGTAILEGDAA